MNCQEIDLIEYLIGNPDSHQTQLVVDHLEKCARCRERLQVMAALEAASGGSPKRYRSKLFLTAAALVIAFLLAIVYPLYFRPPEPASLATSVPYLEFPLEVRDTETGSGEAGKALELYRNGHYLEAAQLLENLPSQSPHLIFYAGVSRYMAGNYREAISHLAIASNDRFWQEPSLWYLANAYLRLNQPESTRDILRQVRDLRGRYSDSAAQLLEELNRADSRRRPVQ